MMGVFLSPVSSLICSSVWTVSGISQSFFEMPVFSVGR
jgi:hypothetical protein